MVSRTTIVVILGWLIQVRSAFVGRMRAWRTSPLQSSLIETSEEASQEKQNNQGRSLVSSFLIDIVSLENEEKWLLTPLESVEGVQSDVGEGAKALVALDSAMPSRSYMLLSCTQEKNRIIAQATEEVEPDLAAVVLRVMVQHLASRAVGCDELLISFPGEDGIKVQGPIDQNGVRLLFSPLVDSSEVEFVEMVTQTGENLGTVPRPLVHSYNLLHRGIGMVVSKDAPIVSSDATRFPDLYVHRRTDTKRIFPSLFDMFVGGVSSANEDSRTTAKREVAEELGLARALTDDAALSNPLFDCIVCTSYNRCVVTVFCFTFDSSTDKVAWQEEEVSWGDFVPYSVIVEAAKLSIRRMLAERTWPGSAHPYALQQRKKENQMEDKYDSQDWSTWDFVPDGLLVWEAWLRWLDGRL